MYSHNNSFEANNAPFINEFFKTFKIGNILHSCGGAKLRGISPVAVLKYLFTLFNHCTMAHDQKVNKDAIKKDTCHRLLESPKIDWNKLLAMMAQAVAKVLEPERERQSPRVSGALL